MITLTPQIISAAAMDAANRSMRAAGRKKWSRGDYNVAVKESDRLYKIYDKIHGFKKVGC